jgi:hypothetical protein
MGVYLKKMVGNKTAMTKIKKKNVASTITCVLVVWGYLFLVHLVYVV